MGGVSSDLSAIQGRGSRGKGGDDGRCECGEILHMTGGNDIGDLPVDGFVVVDCDVAKSHCLFHAQGKFAGNRSLPDPSLPPFCKYPSLVRHEVRIGEEMPLDQFCVVSIAPEQANAMLQYLAQERFADLVKIDQINRAAECARQIAYQGHFDFRGHRGIHRHGQVEVAHGARIALGKRTKQDRHADTAVPDQYVLDQTM